MKQKLIVAMLISSISMALAGAGAYAQEETSEIVMTPWMNTSVLGAVTPESDVPDLKDDFYQAVNHDWISTVQLKPGHVSSGSFVECQDSIDQQLMAIMSEDSATGHDEELLQTLYGMFLDWETRDKLGMTPFLPMLETMEGMDNLDDLTAYLSSEEGLLYGGSMCSLNLGSDRENSDLYGLEINNAGLLLNDSAEYENMTQTGEIYYWLHQQISNLALTKLGYSEEEAQEIFENALELDGMLAPSIMSIEESYAEDAIRKTTNPVTFEELKELSPAFPLTQIMETLDCTDWNSINLNEPQWLAALNEIYTEENVELFKDSLILRYAEQCASLADEETYRAYQEIANAANGITESSSDEKLAYDFASGVLMSSTSKVFTEHYMTEEIKNDVTQIIEEVIAQYREMLANETWLTDETRERAINKLDHITIHAAYPEKWEETDSIQIASKEEGGNLYKAICEIEKYGVSKMQSYKNGEIDHEIWSVPLAQANAFYDPSDNSINIIAGILREPFYSPDMSKEEKMARIGMVIGHELSHAFDTSGSQYDEKGNLADWWTEEDYAEFQKRAQKLVHYYDSMIVLPDGTGYSGTLVQGEAIADIGSVKCLLEIAKGMDNFDYDQFFRSYAEIWKTVYTPETEYMVISGDPHPLAYLRANVTVAQYDEFQETYDIKEGDGMYIKEEDRICVW